MSDKIKRVAVLGLGRVGRLAATLLHETGFEVTGFDVRTLRHKVPFKVEQKSAAAEKDVEALCKGFDAILSCLPYHLNVGVAGAAHQLGLHYFDLTEDVATTKVTQEMSKTSKGHGRAARTRRTGWRRSALRDLRRRHRGQYGHVVQQRLPGRCR